MSTLVKTLFVLLAVRVSNIKGLYNVGVGIADVSGPAADVVMVRVHHDMFPK